MSFYNSVLMSALTVESCLSVLEKEQGLVFTGAAALTAPADLGQASVPDSAGSAPGPGQICFRDDCSLGAG